MKQPHSGIQYVLRLWLERDVIGFSQLLTAVEQVGGDVTALDVVRSDEKGTLRDLTVVMPTGDALEELEQNLQKMPGVRVDNISDRTFLMHLGGKIEICPRVQVITR